MTNLFYTDPLKAAWMAREFDVHFVEPLVFGFHNGQYVIARSPHLDMSREAKYYVHPDSLHIFEPMEGDMVEVRWFDNNGVECSIGYGIVDGDHDIVMGGESIGASGLEDVDSIIQRNGKAFFTPEVQV